MAPSISEMNLCLYQTSTSKPCGGDPGSLLEQKPALRDQAGAVALPQQTQQLHTSESVATSTWPHMTTNVQGCSLSVAKLAFPFFALQYNYLIPVWLACTHHHPFGLSPFDIGLHGIYTELSCNTESSAGSLFILMTKSCSWLLVHEERFQLWIQLIFFFPPAGQNHITNAYEGQWGVEYWFGENRKHFQSKGATEWDGKGMPEWCRGDDYRECLQRSRFAQFICIWGCWASLQWKRVLLQAWEDILIWLQTPERREG